MVFALRKYPGGAREKGKIIGHALLPSLTAGHANHVRKEIVEGIFFRGIALVRPKNIRQMGEIHVGRIGIALFDYEAIEHADLRPLQTKHLAPPREVINPEILRE